PGNLPEAAADLFPSNGRRAEGPTGLRLGWVGGRGFEGTGAASILIAAFEPCSNNRRWLSSFIRANPKPARISRARLFGVRRTERSGDGALAPPATARRTQSGVA